MTSPRMTGTVQQLWRVGPHAGAHHPAVRMGLSVAVPLSVLAVTGHPSWSAWAVLGSIAAAYGRNATARQRLRTQAAAGLLLVAIVVGGTALAAVRAPGVVLVACAAVIAGAGTVIGDLNHWTPPGSLFAVFAFGVCSALPATVADIPLAAVLSLAGLGWALLVTYVVFPVSPSVHAMPRLPLRLTAVHALVCFAGAGIAGGVALALGLEKPAWAMVAAVVPVVGTTTGGQMVRAGHRTVGTLLGVLIAGALFWHEPSALVSALLVGLLLFGAELLMTRNYALALLCVTPVAIGLSRPSTPHALLTLMAARASETCLGVLVAVALILATHRLRARITA